MKKTTCIIRLVVWLVALPVIYSKMALVDNHLLQGPGTWIQDSSELWKILETLVQCSPTQNSSNQGNRTWTSDQVKVSAKHFCYWNSDQVRFYKAFLFQVKYVKLKSSKILQKKVLLEVNTWTILQNFSTLGKVIVTLIK